jgi:AraC-like DNA-binding protein
LLEIDVHEYFKEQRVNPRREMFEIDSYTAQRVIEELGYKYSTALWDHNRQ